MAVRRDFARQQIRDWLLEQIARNELRPGDRLVGVGGRGTWFVDVEGPLEYDPVAMKITNNAEADALLRSEYREGWSL